MARMTHEQRWEKWKADTRGVRVWVKIHYSFTHPYFLVDGRVGNPRKHMEREILVPHDGPLTEDAMWEHIYALIHPDRRTISGTRLTFPEWLGDDILPRRFNFCDRRGRLIDHRTPREVQAASTVRVMRREGTLA